MYERGFEFVIGKVINSHIFLNVKHVHSFFFFEKNMYTVLNLYTVCKNYRYYAYRVYNHEPL